MKYCGSENLECTDKCGGILCSHCGESLECSKSFKKTYENFANLTQYLNQTYSKRELEMKNILSKKNSDRLGYKNFNENVNNVHDNLAKQLDDIEQKTTYVRNLISEMFNASDQYQFKITKIEQNNQHSLNLNDKSLDEEDFDFKLALIKEQEQVLKNNVEYVKTDLKRRNQTEVLWPKNLIDPSDFKLEINKIVSQNEEIEFSMKQNEKALLNKTINFQEIEENSTKINETLNSVESILTKLKEKKTKAESDITDAEDISLFDFENLMKVDEIRQKIKIGNINLLRSKEIIETLSLKFEASLNKMRSSTTNENVLKLTELMDKITLKQNKIRKKAEKIDELKSKNQKLKNVISKSKEEIHVLKIILEKIKANIKVNNFHQRVCQ